MRGKLFAAAVAVLTATGFAAARGDDKDTSGPSKPAGKKVTVEELGAMLDAMGYEPKAVLNKDGKLVAHEMRIKTDGWTVLCRAELSTSTTQIWFSWMLARVDAKDPPSAAALLAMLEANEKIWPGYVNYVPAQGKMDLSYPLANANVTPAAIRTALDGYIGGVKHALTTWKKVTAEAKARADAKNQGPREVVIP